VLRLLETFALEEVTHAIEDALRLGTISFDAVRHLVLCRIERRPPRLDMANWPHLPLPSVRTTRAADYMSLLCAPAVEPPHWRRRYEHNHCRYATGPARTSPEGSAAAHHAARVRQAGPHLRGREGRLPNYLLRLTELELLDRDRRATERRIRQAKFPVVKSLDSFDFLAIPALNKTLVLELARCEYLTRKENILLLGNSGTGKTHIALALGLAACQRGHRVRFITAAALVGELIEARDEKRLLRFQKQIAAYELLIVDELGYVPLSKTGAELLFETISQRYERNSTLITSNLPFDEWTEIFGSERLTGALLDRLTHHVHILEMNGDSYRLKQSRRKQA
jgi:DNA replication protein DnaC